MPNPKISNASSRGANRLRRAALLGLCGLVLSLGLATTQGTRVAAADRPVKLLAFGDSLIHGYGLATGKTFPQQLEAALRKRGFAVEVINAGNSGDTTAAGRARLDWALADDPDLILVELGANDALRGIEPSDTYRNLDFILTRLKAQKVEILFAGMRAPRNLGADYANEFDQVFPRLAKKHAVAFYPFFLDGVALDPALNQDDGIHPNARGVAVIVKRIIPAIERLIEGRGKSKGGADG